MALLRRVGEVPPAVAGQVLFREGDRGSDFIVVLLGRVTIVDHQAGAERELLTAGPRQFAAEPNLLTGERLFTTAVVTEPGTVLMVPRAHWGADRGDQALGELILQAVLAWREWLARRQAGGPAGRRVAVLAADQPPAGVRRTEPAPAHLAGYRHRSGGRGGPR